MAEQEDKEAEDLKARIAYALYMAPTTADWFISQDDFRKLAHTGEFAPKPPDQQQ